MHTASASASHRRGFLKTIAWLAGAVALVFRGGKLYAEESRTEGCSAEIDKLKNAVRDTRFDELRDKARYLRRVHAKFGNGVIDEVSKLTSENAENWMKNADIPKEKRNLEEVKKFFAGVGASAAYTWVEDTPERLQARVTQCRWAAELKKDGNDGELGYALCCAFDHGFCAGLNPSLKFTRTKTIMMGDEYCNHTYELKS